MLQESLYFWEIQILQWFKLYFPQINRIVQLYTSDSDSQGAGNIHGAFLLKCFQFFRHIFNNVSSNTKVPSIQRRFLSREQLKISWSQVRRLGELLQCCHAVFAKKSLATINRCAGALSWRRNQLLVLHFSGRFILKVAIRQQRMSVHITLFPVLLSVWQWTISWQSTSSIFDSREFRELFEANIYIYIYIYIHTYICTCIQTTRKNTFTYVCMLTLWGTAEVSAN
jgi:hypothetical protein